MMKNIFFVLMTVAAQLSISWTAAVIGLEAEETAPYTVIKEAKNYEMRAYPQTKWVCRDHVATTFRNRDQALLFFDLFDYISGQNSAEIKINMTAPVSMYTKLNADSEGNTLYQMCFYLPKSHQENPPQPTVEGGAYIEDRPALTVAVKRFGGFMRKQSDWEVQKEVLKTDLKADNEQNFDFDNFYGCGYDAPFKFTDRRNEVWLVKNQ